MPQEAGPLDIIQIKGTSFLIQTLPSPDNRGSSWGVAIKITVSVLLLGLVGYQALGNEMAGQLLQQPKRWEWLLAGFICVGAGYTLSFVRWWCLVIGAGLSLRVGTAIRWSLMSQPFQLISFGVAGGDLLRIYLLCSHHPRYKAHAAATVLMDRGIGLWTMFAAVATVGCSIHWPSLAAADPVRSAGLVQVWRLAVGLVGTVGIGGSILLAVSNTSWPGRLAAMMPTNRLRGLGANLVRLLPVYRRQPLVLVAALLLSAANVVCLSTAVFCVARSLTTETPGFWDHLLLTPISLIAGAAPLPGGLGSQELVMSWMYAAFSTELRNTDYGILVAAGYRFLTLILVGLGWLLYASSGRQGGPAADGDREL